MFTGKEQPVAVNGQTDLKRLNTGGRIRLGSNLPPGEYVLQIIVTDLLAQEKHRVAAQWTDLEIIKK